MKSRKTDGSTNLAKGSRSTIMENMELPTIRQMLNLRKYCLQCQRGLVQEFLPSPLGTFAFIYFFQIKRNQMSEIRSEYKAVQARMIQARRSGFRNRYPKANLAECALYYSASSIGPSINIKTQQLNYKEFFNRCLIELNRREDLLREYEPQKIEPHLAEMRNITAIR